MLNSEIKRKIDNARDILVGKIPVPMSQIEQITIALIYKFMSDIDEQNKELGWESFFYWEFEKYSWKNLMDKRIWAQERMNLYVEGLEMMTKNERIPELFRNIFRNAYLPFRDPQVLDRFLKQIDEFSYDHSEDLWNAFEYLLSTAWSQWDAGQFRTPRHIIDFIVSVVQPTKDDTILDPACGTAWFLISAYKYILKQNTAKFLWDKLSVLEREKLTRNFVGYDISHEMVRLSLVNMYLHRFPDPKIFEYDTLSDDARWNEEFSCILANPPFMTPKGGIKPHDRFSIKAKKSEVLFVDYIMEHLTINWKAWIIVPEWIIFQSANAYKQLRKKMIEQNFLYAVVSLPSWVFQPYSWVKTSILLFDKKIAKKTDKILFVKIENDGFDLWAQRRPIDKNDLPKAKEIIVNYKLWIINDEINLQKTSDPAFLADNLLKEFLENENLLWKKKVLLVEKSKIAESGDYNLSMERYRVNEELGMMNGKWEMVELGEVCELWRWFAFKSKDYVNNWILNFRVTNIWDDWYPNLKDTKFLPIQYKEKYKEYLLKEWDFVIVMVGATTWKVWIITKDILPALLNQNMWRFFPKKNINKKYLFYIIKKIPLLLQWWARDYLTQKDFLKIKIPLPSLEIQKQIVEELDAYQKIIDGAKQVVENYKLHIDIDPSWEMVELGEVCEVKSWWTPSKSKKEYWEKWTIPWFWSTVCKNKPVYKPTNFITDEWLKNSSAKVFKVNTTLIALVWATIWKTALLKIEWATNQNIAWLYPLDTNKLDVKFLFYISQTLYDKFLKIWEWKFRMASLSFVRSLKIPLPPLEVQKQIVEKIEEEQKLVEANKKLIEMFEKKIEERVRRVWEG